MTNLEQMNRQFETSERARAFLAWGVAKALSNGTAAAALTEFERRMGTRATPHLAIVQRAAVAAATTSDATWAGPLSEERLLSGAFLELVRKRSVLGAMLPFVRPAPPNTKVGRVLTGASAGWVGENKPIPASKLTVDTATLDVTKLATIVVFGKELLRATDDASARLVERDVVRAVALTEDETLLDGLAAVANVRPASILFGLANLGTGGSPTSIEDDVVSLLANVSSGEAAAPFFIASASGARFLATVRDVTSGQKIFPSVTIRGGDILGVPLIVTAGAHARLVLVDAATLLLADLGIELDSSEHATIEASDDPTDGAVSQVSFWQDNLVGLRAIRYLNWELGRANGAGFIDLPVEGSPA